MAGVEEVTERKYIKEVECETLDDRLKGHWMKGWMV